MNTDIDISYKMREVVMKRQTESMVRHFESLIEKAINSDTDLHKNMIMY